MSWSAWASFGVGSGVWLALLSARVAFASPRVFSNMAYFRARGVAAASTPTSRRLLHNINRRTGSSGSASTSLVWKRHTPSRSVRSCCAAAFVTRSSQQRRRLQRDWITAFPPMQQLSTLAPTDLPLPLFAETVPSISIEGETEFSDLEYFNSNNGITVQQSEQDEDPSSVMDDQIRKDGIHAENDGSIKHQAAEDSKRNSPHRDDNDNNPDEQQRNNDHDASLFQGIRSRPKEGGTWDPADPLGWTQSFGTRSSRDSARLAVLAHLRPGDDGYCSTADRFDLVPDGVTIVRTPEEAQTVLAALRRSRDEDPSRVHACDTEVMDIDLKQVGPVGHGYVTCLSVYSGPDFDYGLPGGPGTMLWVDNLDDSHGLLQEFKEWLEDDGVLKLWHNYGFDRHVLYNEGIDVRGLGGDTMHMARLADTSRMKYSLESLTEDLLGKRKVPMKEIFGEPRLRKDGTPGALIDLPPMERLQRDPKFRKDWIKYSAFDAKSTYDLYQNLKEKLEKTSWIPDYSLFHYYHTHMRPFGELLTDLERRGILVATDYLAGKSFCVCLCARMCPDCPMNGFCIDLFSARDQGLSWSAAMINKVANKITCRFHVLMSCKGVSSSRLTVRIYTLKMSKSRPARTGKIMWRRSEDGRHSTLARTAWS